MPNEGRTADTDDLSHKVCTKCGEKKHICNFPKRATSKDGYSSWCKDCHRTATRNAERKRYHEDEEYRKANKEKVAKRRANESKEHKEARLSEQRQRDKERYATDTDYREKVKQKNLAAYHTKKNAAEVS